MFTLTNYLPFGLKQHKFLIVELWMLKVFRGSQEAQVDVRGNLLEPPGENLSPSKVSTDVTSSETAPTTPSKAVLVTADLRLGIVSFKS